MKFVTTLLMTVLFSYYAFGQAKIENVIIENDLSGQKSILIVNYDISNYSSSDRYLVNLSFYDEYQINTIFPTDGCITGANNNTPIKGGSKKRMVWDFENEVVKVLHDGHFSLDLITLSNDITKDVLKRERLSERQLRIRDKMNKSKKHGIIYLWRKWRYNRLTARITKKNNKIELQIDELY